MDLGQLVRKFLPSGTLDEFTVTNFSEKAGQSPFEEMYFIELTEKEYAPSGFGNARLRQKGYAEKREVDFPIRGRKTVLIYRRRKWQIEGRPGIYVREMEITAEGVKLTPEFAFFFEGAD